MYNELYQVSKSELIAKDEKFKLYQLVKGSYEFKGEVLRKDYKGIKEKTRKKGHYLVRFEREDKAVVKLIHQDDLDKEEEKQQKEENKYLLKSKDKEEKQEIINKAKIEFNKNIRTLNKTLVNLDISNMDLEKLEQYNIYLLSIIEKVETGNLKDISTTKQINKKSKIALYKNNIYNYIMANKFTSINLLCKDLNINRRTLYNYKLDEYIKELL